MNNNGQKSPKGAGKSSFELIDLNILTDTLPAPPGSVVLDLACGKGAYSLLLSGMVGRNGIVYAVDLWKEGLEILADQIETGNIKNILPLLADATREIEIDEYSLDLCLMATVLHDFEEAAKAHTVYERLSQLGLSLEYALSQVFSPKQKELFKKRLEGLPLTKTEKEYYSRTVKKKVVALANPELHRMAQRLMSY